MPRLTLIPRRRKSNAPAVQETIPVATTLSVQRDMQMTPDELREYERACQRLVDMPNDFGWIFFAVGVIGIILPGIPGIPFIIVGGAVLLPGGRSWLSRQTARKPGKAMRSFVRQFNRFLDDFERDCPRLPPA